jgi:hypothetical protein
MTIRPIITVLVYAVTAAMSTISAQDSGNDAALRAFKPVYEQELKRAGVIGSAFAMLRKYRKEPAG